MQHPFQVLIITLIWYVPQYTSSRTNSKNINGKEEDNATEKKAMNLIYYHLLKAGICKLWAVSWIQPPPVFGNKVLLENNHAHSLRYCLWLFSCFYYHYSENPTVEISTFERDQLACKSINYLLFDPLKKRFANPWSNVKSSEDAMNLYCFRKVDQSGENVTSDLLYFMCSRLLCDFLRTGKRDFYMLLPCPSAPGSYSPK